MSEGRAGGWLRRSEFRGFVKKGWAYRQLTAGLKRFNHDDSDPGIRYIPGNGQSTGDKNGGQFRDIVGAE